MTTTATLMAWTTILGSKLPLPADTSSQPKWGSSYGGSEWVRNLRVAGNGEYRYRPRHGPKPGPRRRATAREALHFTSDSEVK